jgi:crotonobetainyl-CoA:carnitine CoA-transferase CaiB-like acyl-CoA transferase
MSPAPDVGQDSRSILTDAGYSSRDIDQLVERRVVHTAMATP